ncbi:MAG TPA: TonB-dependent receptor [Bryobacteraceae bacterium]|nr:TonB-dependent receptor [Bryobacteraceae bacterium]
MIESFAQSQARFNRGNIHGLEPCARASAWTLVRPAVAVLVCLATTLSWNADAQIKDPAEPSLEQLMNIEITSASKKEQRLADTAASVFVITREMIQRSGLTSVPEALRLAPGVEVARIDAAKWAIGIRGFSTLLTNKLLVLVDGRSVYNDTFSGVYWAAQDMPLEEIERIEIVRGPVAAIWGANAVNGVINIITRSPRDIQGATVTAGGGGDMAGYGSASYSGAIGSRGYIRSYAGYRVHDALLGPPGSNDGNWIHRSGGFRMEFDLSGSDSLTLEGQGYTGNENDVINYLSSFRYNPGALQNEPLFYSGGSIRGEWKHTISDRSWITLAAYYDSYAESETDVDKTLGVTNIEMEHHFAFSPRHELVWGLGYRGSDHDSVQGRPIYFQPIFTNLFSGFVQDEYALIPDRLHVIAGTQMEHNSYTGFEIQPSLRLLWQPARKYSTWAAVSRAVRTPNVVETRSTYTFLDYDLGRIFPVVAMGTPDQTSETLLGYELGQRIGLGGRLSLDLSAFYNFYKHLVIESPSHFYMDARGFVVMPDIYTNIGSARTYGADASLELSPARNWNLSFGYSWLRLLPSDYSQRLSSTEIPGPTDPQHQAQLHSNWDVTKNVQLDASVYYLGSIPAFAIPDHWRVDVRLGWRPSRHLEFSLAGQDLLSPAHAEYLMEVFGRTMEVPRAITGYARWSF